MKALCLTSLVALILSTFWANPAAGGQGTQPGRVKVDVSTLGPQVGQRVPDFSLRDQNGRTQTLQTIVGPRGAMLVFLRSADW